MKIVREHIDFERGQEPYSAMDIGNKVLRNYEKLDSILRKFGFKEVDIDFKEIPNWGKTFDEVFHKWVNWNDQTVIMGKKKHVSDIEVGFNSPATEIRPRQWGIIPIEETLSANYWIKHWGLNPINENLDFERGLNPKTALDIGLTPRLNPITLKNTSDGTDMGEDPMVKIEEVFKKNRYQIYLLGVLDFEFSSKNERDHINEIEDLIRNYSYDEKILEKTRKNKEESFWFYNTSKGKILKEKVNKDSWYWGDIDAAIFFDIVNKIDLIEQ